MENDWINKGNQFYKKERFEEAINCYDQSIKLDPKNAGVWNNRGLSFDNLNRHQDAIQCYNKALKINPQNFHAWCNLGISFAEMNQSEKALTCFDKALGFNSKHVLSWQKKGDGLRSLGRYEEAIRCYMMAVKLDDNNILAWYNKGLCEDKIGLNAFLSYSNVMMLAMGLDSEFVMDGGRAALEVRHVERVKIKQEYLDHAVKRMSEINRKEPSADNRKKTVNHDASVKGSTSAVAPPQNKALSIPAEKSQKQSGADIHEQNANQWYIKGKQLCDLENYEEAIHCFENALGLEPEYAYAWREKGFCEDNLGRTIDAIHSYKQVLEFAEDDEPGLVQSAIARLAELGRDASLSVNHVKNITSQNPKTNREATYQPGDVIGQEYEVIKVLGSGGFGVVYLVYDRFTKNECALKTMHSRLLADSKIRDLFRKEANVLVELDRHPYLVRTYFVDEFSGILFIAMEYIAPNDQGINSLAGYLKNRQPELQQNLRWAIQICLGMEYAYSKGIRTHRDLKPENIMITQEGTVKITDFGLAGVLDAVMVSSKKLSGGVGIFGKTQGGAVFGTLSHMSPEQFSNAASCDERSDIYSLGIMLFQMESGGELPFLAVPPRDDSSEESIRFGLEMRQLHLETSAPRLNSHLYPIIQRCLEKNPGKRYQSFSKLRSDLEPLLKQINGEVIRIPQLGKLSVQDLCYKGINLSSLERYEDAICFFDKALDIEPNNVGALNDKGKSLNSLGRHEEALHYLDKALEINPLFASAITNKGLSLSQLGRSEEALRYYDKSLEISPQNVASLINKGNYFNGIGRYEDGIVCFNLVLEIDCNDIDAYLGKGRSFYGLGNYQESIYLCDKALEINPRDELAWEDKGNCFTNLGRYEDAIRCFDKAIEINPKNPIPWSNKGNCLNTLNEFEEAIYYFDKALEIDPCNVNALNNKGFTLSKLDRIEEAIYYFDKLLEIDPCDTNALGNKGASLHGLERYKEAIHFYEKVLELNPRDVNAWNNKGKSFNSLGRYEDTLRCFDEALEIDSRNVGTLNNKSDILRNLGRYEEAIQYCDKALEIDQRNAPALHNKGNCLISLGFYKEDLRKLEQSLTINGNRENLSGMAENLFNMATIYAELDEYFTTLRLAQQSVHLWGQINHPMKKKAQELITRIKESRAIFLDEIIENFQKANSPAEIQILIKRYPIITEDNFLFVPKEIPPEARPAYKQRLKWLTEVVNNVAKNAHEAFFYQIDSLAKLHIVVTQYPIMIGDKFIGITEQIINEQIPPQKKPPYNRLLSWLKQMAIQ